MTNRIKSLISIAVAAIVSLAMCSCIEDGVTTSANDQPVFSVDTLKIGTVFTDEVTTTHRFTVRNPHAKGLNISEISLDGANAQLFRLNVDGQSGTKFNNVEIRAKDSIYVFVEATLPANNRDLPVEIDADIKFVTNGVVRNVVVNAVGQDVERLRAHTVSGDITFSNTKPYQIFDSLVVAPDATLRLKPGTQLCFHDGAQMIVRGTLIAEGTVDNPVELRGDRTGNVITDITFDLMSRQWTGLQFTPSSQDNVLSHTIVRNTWFGVIVSGDGQSGSTPKLALHNSRLRNSGDRVLEVYHADVSAVGCEFAEAANGSVLLNGGNHVFNHCTFANYYLFSAIGGAALQLAHINDKTDDGSGQPYTRADITNSILYGLGTDIYPGNLDGTSVTLRHCLLKSAGNDDGNFVNCLWDTDPLYLTVREDYLFDYRLKADSPAIGAGSADLTLPAASIDPYGTPRATPPTLGAYEYVPASGN